MATPTSSSNRSKRKTNQPVTTDKGRTNRARVSTAKTTSSTNRSSNSGARVTNASQRTSTNSARVTGTSRPALPARSSASDLQRLQTASRTKPTRPAPRATPKPNSRPALPPGTKGGDLATNGTRRSRAEAKASAAAKGSTGPNRVGRSDARPALPPGKPGGALTRGSSGALARTASSSGASALRAAAKAGGGVLNKAVVPLAMAGEVNAMMDRDRRWNDYKERTGLNKKTDAQTGGTRRGAAAGTRTKPNATPTKPPVSSTGVRTPKGNAVPTGSPKYNDYRNKQLADERERLKGVGNTTAPKPSTRSTSSAPASSSPARSSGGSSRPKASSAPKPASNAGLKNQDKNYRGNVFEKTFGYKPGQAPDQVKARQDKAANPSNFDTKSNLADELKVSKVDGSKYADKKPDMNKVKEYDRRKRKYYDN